jgi:hypothetical protein
MLSNKLNRLAAVNFFLGVVGIVQVCRILVYQQSLKKLPAAIEEVKQEGEKVATA